MVRKDPCSPKEERSNVQIMRGLHLQSPASCEGFRSPPPTIAAPGYLAFSRGPDKKNEKLKSFTPKPTGSSSNFVSYDSRSGMVRKTVGSGAWRWFWSNPAPRPIFKKQNEHGKFGSTRRTCLVHFQNNPGAVCELRHESVRNAKRTRQLDNFLTWSNLDSVECRAVYIYERIMCIENERLFANWHSQTEINFCTKRMYTVHQVLEESEIRK